jgi:hypothetical protein
MFLKEYVERVVKPKEQCGELGLPAPKDRMPSNYYNLIDNTKKVYYVKSGEPAVKFRTRSGKALEKRI